MYLPATNSLTLDNISFESTFVMSENISCNSSYNTSIISGNIYESVRTLDEDSFPCSLLEQDGYLVPQGRYMTTKL